MSGDSAPRLPATRRRNSSSIETGKFANLIDEGRSMLTRRFEHVRVVPLSLIVAKCHVLCSRASAAAYHPDVAVFRPVIASSQLVDCCRSQFYCTAALITVKRSQLLFL